MDRYKTDSVACIFDPRFGIYDPLTDTRHSFVLLCLLDMIMKMLMSLLLLLSMVMMMICLLDG